METGRRDHSTRASDKMRRAQRLRAALDVALTAAPRPAAPRQALESAAAGLFAAGASTTLHVGGPFSFVASALSGGRVSGPLPPSALSLLRGWAASGLTPRAARAAAEGDAPALAGAAATRLLVRGPAPLLRGSRGELEGGSTCHALHLLAPCVLPVLSLLVESCGHVRGKGEGEGLPPPLKS